MANTGQRKTKRKNQKAESGYSASHRYARIAPRKVRPVADLVRGKFAVEALEILQYQPQRGAKMLYKVIESALNNAQNPDQPAGAPRTANLRVANVQVDGAPMFKRLRPRARGMAFMIKKRLSHINVTLAEASDE